MLYPSINELREKVDSKYTLVILAAKRARAIVDGFPSLLDNEKKNTKDKAVSVAAMNIENDDITYKRI